MYHYRSSLIFLDDHRYKFVSTCLEMSFLVANVSVDLPRYPLMTHIGSIHIRDDFLRDSFALPLPLVWTTTLVDSFMW